MRLEQISLQRIRIPFREPFRHSSAVRSETESVLVTARDASGLAGYGESCPRTYVTGETLASVERFFAATSESIRSDVSGMASLRAWMAAHVTDIDANPAAWCAIELSLLDLFARSQSKSVEALLGIAGLSGPFAYSAIVGEGSFESFCRSYRRYAALGMHDIKLKVSGDPDSDRRKLRYLEEQGAASLRVRLDGNNLWSSADDAAAYIRALDYPLFAFEEPLAGTDRAALLRLAATSGVTVILDESFTRIGHFRQLDGAADRILINLRVSKMGGVVRSLAIVDEARRRGVGLIIGAQVGETSLLTRAALTVAEQARDLLRAQEGAFGSLLLERDPWEPSLRFGAGGVLLPQPIGGDGFGLELMPSAAGRDDLSPLRSSDDRD